MDLAPGFLIASPTMRCSFFSRSVVLLVSHAGDGSLGFVVNQGADVDLPDVLSELGIVFEKPAPSAPVLVGGPVNPYSGWVVFDPSKNGECPDPTVRVSSSIAVSSSVEMLHTIAGGDGPDRSVMMLGYSGWGPGQLDDEIREGSWIPADLDEALVFETPLEERWTRALSSLGIDPARVVSGSVAEA